MVNGLKPQSFRDQMIRLIANAENKRVLDDSEMQQLEVCFALSSLLTLSHHATYPSEGEEVTATQLIAAQDNRRKMARLMLDVIAGRKEHEILDKVKSREQLAFHAGNADMMVKLVRRAMLELGPPPNTSASAPSPP
jgi:hypothetical protein